MNLKEIKSIKKAEKETLESNDQSRPLTLVFYGEKEICSSNNNLSSMRAYLSNKITNNKTNRVDFEKDKLIDIRSDSKEKILWDKFLILKNNSISRNFEEINNSSNSKIEKMLKSIVDIVK